MRVKMNRVEINGMAIPYLEAGSGPLVICLHGFPDQPESWQPVMHRIAEAGYRVAAPVLRGYAPGATAPDGNYREWATASDAVELIARLGYETAILIGHDWGAAAAYSAAAIAPDSISNLVTLAVPYGPAFGHAMFFDAEQQRRSWYWFFLQHAAAEAAVAHDDFAFIQNLWRDWSPGFEPDAAHMRGLKDRFAAEGVLGEVLKYYRQALGEGPPPPPDIAECRQRPIMVPTLYLHGLDDGCIGAELSEETERYFAAFYRRKLIEGAGHFLHVEKPEIISEEILRFLDESGQRTAP